MPAPGPVAYQVQLVCLVVAVICVAALQLSPSLSDRSRNTRRVSVLVPAMIMDSLSVPRFQVLKSQMVPVTRSTTGAGLPQVFAPSLQTRMAGPQVAPLSAERRTSRSMSPVSEAEFLRPSQKASRVPLVVRTRAGIR